MAAFRFASLVIESLGFGSWVRPAPDLDTRHDPGLPFAVGSDLPACLCSLPDCALHKLAKCIYLTAQKHSQSINDAPTDDSFTCMVSAGHFMHVDL